MGVFRFGAWPAALLAVAACSAFADETRRVQGLEFDHIDVVGSMSVEIRQGDVHELTLRGSAEDLDREPFYIDGRRLVLGRSGSWDRDNFGDVKYRVELPQLRALQLKGSGDVYVRRFELIPERPDAATRFSVDGSGDIKVYGVSGPAVEFRVKGSGDIKAQDVDVRQVSAIVAGSGDLFIQRLQAQLGEFVVTGSGDIAVTEKSFVQTMEVNVVGSGDIDLRSADSDVVEVNIVGSGQIDLGEVFETLQGAILGSGDVRYDGDPVVETVELGSGECRRRD